MSSRRFIGPSGTVARAVVGTALVALAVWSPAWWASGGPLWLDALLGLALIPAVILAVQWLRTLFTSEKLGATGHTAFCLNVAVAAAFFSFGYTRDAAALFYGASMFVAVARGYAGCEMFAISNWLLRRDDQVGCILFSPIDALEARVGSSGRAQRAGDETAGS